MALEAAIILGRHVEAALCFWRGEARAPAGTDRDVDIPYQDGALVDAQRTYTCIYSHLFTS